MPAPIQESATNIDLGPRFFKSTTVAASPAAATETIIASITVGGDLALSQGIYVMAFAAFTVGTNGDAATLKVRRTDASGATVASTGATNAGVLAATQLTSMAANGFDALGSSVQSQVYVATLTVANANAASTVSAVTLAAWAI